MDREELIDRVNEMTSGNRHDYLTRKDVGQIVDATIRVMSGAADAGQTGQELEDVSQAPQEGDEQVQRGEGDEQSQPQAS
jgi:hypothetical protein